MQTFIEKSPEGASLRDRIAGKRFLQIQQQHQKKTKTKKKQ